MNERKTKRDGDDFFPTPPWVTRMLLREERFTGSVHEPACGCGVMARTIADAGYTVTASDLRDRGFGEWGVDFLAGGPLFDNIVTNPPYLLAEEFVHEALRRARRKVALLLRVGFLYGAERYGSLYSVTPPSRVYIIPHRVTFAENGFYEGSSSGKVDHAWCVWDSHAKGFTTLHWLEPVSLDERRRG